MLGETGTTGLHLMMMMMIIMKMTIKEDDKGNQWVITMLVRR